MRPARAAGVDVGDRQHAVDQPQPGAQRRDRDGEMTAQLDALQRQLDIGIHRAQGGQIELAIGQQPALRRPGQIGIGRALSSAPDRQTTGSRRPAARSARAAGPGR